LAAYADEPTDFGHTWEPVGDSYILDDGRVEQWIRITLTKNDQPVKRRSYPIRWEQGDPDSTARCEQMAEAYFKAHIRDNVYRINEHAQEIMSTLEEELFAMWGRVVDRVYAMDVPPWNEMNAQEKTDAVYAVEDIWQEEAATLAYVRTNALGEYIAALADRGFANRSDMWIFLLKSRGWG